jgi:hypothetical protein
MRFLRTELMDSLSERYIEAEQMGGENIWAALTNEPSSVDFKVNTWPLGTIYPSGSSPVSVCPFDLSRIGDEVSISLPIGRTVCEFSLSVREMTAMRPQTS